MTIDASVPRSPGWWLKTLGGRLAADTARFDKLDRYYEGRPDLPEGAQGHHEAYRRFQSKARVNFAELVVEAVRDRMRPAGFRTGADGDDLGDREAWRIWQANQLDADWSLISQAFLTMSTAYAIVGPVDDETGVPVITPEDPRQVITAHDPIRRRKVIAALKVFVDDWGFEWAYVYLPGEVYKARRKAKPGRTFASWEWDSPDAQRLEVPVVPVVRFENRPRLLKPAMGEFEGVVDTLDRINHMLLQRLVIATKQAFMQMAVKGVPQRDEAGNPIDYSQIFPVDPGALWALPAEAELWQGQQADLSGILNAVRHDIQDLAASTKTPLFYLTPDAANGSAEGASLAREGLVAKVVDRTTQAGEALEQVMSLAFLFAGDPERAGRGDMEVLWESPERFSLAERYDAAVKAQAAGVPWRSVMTDVLQFSPQQTTRMEADRAADALLAAAMAPPAPAPAETEPLPPAP